MSKNEEYLADAENRIKEFSAGRDGGLLVSACKTLGVINLATENKAETRNKIRERCLICWLKLVHILDKYMDPAFNREADAGLPMRLPLPVAPNGTTYAQIADIKDPKQRTQYEKAREEHREKLNNRRLQIILQQEKNHIVEGAKRFITGWYTTAAPDVAEVKSAVGKFIPGRERKEELITLLAPQPS